MFWVDTKSFATHYTLAIIFFSLPLLSGCLDDNDKKSSSSRSSSTSSAISSSSSSSALSSSSLSSSSSSSSSSSLSSSAIPSDSRYLGDWYASAYGFVLSITAEQGGYLIKTYSLTKDYCLLQDVDADFPPEGVQQKYGYANDINEKLLETRGKYSPAIEFKKLDKLPNLCQQSLQKLKGDTAYQFNAKHDFEIFWQTFNELYVNFDVRGVDWDEVYKEASKSVADVKDEDELFDFLTALIEPLGDAHAILLKAPLTQDLFESLIAALDNQGTRLSSGATQPTLYEKLINEYLQTLEPGSEPSDAQMAAARDYFIANHNRLIENIFSYADRNAEIKMRANDEIAWFKTEDNIGYLFIGSMSDLSEGESPILDDVVSDVAIAEATMKEALNDLANTKGLIIDVRFNDGGHDEVSLTFVRHFINQSQVVYSKFAGKGASTTPVKNILLDPQPDSTYIKPTAVLVSGDSVSGAEVFTIAMLSLPQVTLIGEQTAGAFSDILIKRLTSDIAFGISNETYLDVQGKNYEGIGIPPDIAVPFATLQERKGGYDAGLDKAIDWIKSAP